MGRRVRGSWRVTRRPRSHLDALAPTSNSVVIFRQFRQYVDISVDASTMRDSDSSQCA
jgi:hypothetical protein